MLKTFYIETFGCQMNKSDSDLMKVSMEDAGFVPASDLNTADIAVYNTCSVRQHAEERVTARIMSARKQIRERNGIIAVAGCMAQRKGRSLIKDRIADLVIGPYQSPSIGKRILEYLENRQHCAFLSQEPEDFESRLSPGLINSISGEEWRQFVTITHGCENFCAYCIVPYVRGKLISFPSGDILDSIKKLTDKGITEITLLGQNVNQFGQDTGDIPFWSLLDRAASVPGVQKLSFLTSHPKDFSPEIIRVIGAHPNISRSIHLPLQSGSDPVLEAMNRQYTLSGYMEIIEKIDELLDDYAVTTDLIVGFPGETKLDFARTLEAVNTIRFDDAYTYAYSPREGTPAYDIPETITREEKTERLNELIELQRSISAEKLSARINRVESFIPDKISRRSGTELSGRTFLGHPAVINGTEEDIGRLLRIRIESIRGATLQGSIIV